MSESEKYRQFRNFMTNELGITRQDIEAWTKQAVATEIEKLIGQMNVEELASDAIHRCAEDAIGRRRFGQSGASELRDALAKMLAKKITIEVSA